MLPAQANQGCQVLVTEKCQTLFWEWKNFRFESFCYMNFVDFFKKSSYLRNSLKCRGQPIFWKRPNLASFASKRPNLATTLKSKPATPGPRNNRYKPGRVCGWKEKKKDYRPSGKAGTWGTWGQTLLPGQRSTSLAWASRCCCCCFRPSGRPWSWSLCCRQSPRRRQSRSSRPCCRGLCRWPAEKRDFWVMSQQRHNSNLDSFSSSNARVSERD